MVVNKVNSGDTYIITSLINKGNPNYTTTAHVSKIKSYHLPEEYAPPTSENEPTTDEDKFPPEESNQQQEENIVLQEEDSENQIKGTSDRSEEKESESNLKTKLSIKRYSNDIY